MRHGVAIESDAAGAPKDDGQRALTKAGAKRARKAARGLQALGVSVEHILTSPLVRAAQTADIVLHVLKPPPSSVTETTLLAPGGDVKALLQHVRKLEGDCLVVGHAPHLDVLLSVAIGRQRGVLSRLKKAAVACVDFGSTRAQTGQLEWLLPPAVLRKLA